MDIDLSSGLLKDVPQQACTNYNERPDATDVSLLVIHNISMPDGVFGNDYIRQLFMNELDCDEHQDFEKVRGLRLSAHVVIDRAGQITQFVPFDKRAWHAGVSRFEDRDDCNDFSIGVELEGTDNAPFEPIQYDTLAALTRSLMRAYPSITQARIVGHVEIAPGRKTDPGPSFAWKHYFALL